MVSKYETESYLKRLKEKIKIFGIYFLDEKGKNQQTLLDLEISPDKRKDVINSLEAKDYSEGPLKEKMRGILPSGYLAKK
ncbi:MAG: hypothetical protein AB2L24_30790 [Mangrovibacterium sp.]